MSTLLFSAIATPCAADELWDIHGDLQGILGDYRQGGGAFLFVPYVQSENGLTFSELAVNRLKHWTAGSAGVGFRRLFSTGFCEYYDIGFGLNAFFDYTRSDNQISYYQGSIGAELFGSYWEAHANAYYTPTRNTIVSRTLSPELYVGAGLGVGLGAPIFADNFFVDQVESSYPGFDVEVGAVLPVCCGRLRGYAGYFCYRNHKFNTLQGPSFRLEYAFDNTILPRTKFTVGVEWQRDHVRGSESGAYARLIFPFGCKRTPTCWGCCPRPPIVERMGELVRRENGSLLHVNTDRVFINTSRVATIFFVNNAGTGTGTQLDPTNLTSAQTNSVAGDVIFLLNTNGTIPISQAPGSPLTLKDNQQLYSFDAQNPVSIGFGSQGSLQVFDLTNQGAATIDGTGGTPDIVLANGNTLFGFTINATGGTAVSGTSIANGTINDVTFQNFSGGSVYGVVVGDATGTWNFTNDTFSNFAATTGATTAIQVTNSAGSTIVNLSNTTFSNITTTAAASAAGVVLGTTGSASMTVNATGNNFSTITDPSGADSGGIFAFPQANSATFTYNVSNNTLNSISGTGIILGSTAAMTGSTVTANVTGNKITSMGVNGISFSLQGATNNTFGITASSNTITTTGTNATGDQGGIFAQVLLSNINSKATFLFQSNTTTTSSVYGIAIENLANGAGVTNANFQSNTDTGSVKAGYAVIQNSPFTGKTLVELTSNNTNNSTGIVLENNSGVFQVYNLSTLSDDNNGINVSQPGSAGIDNSTTPPPAP